MMDSPNMPQPKPHPGRGPAIPDLVVADIRERDAAGTKKYGQRLQAHDGRNHLIDAYQEALDLVMYLRQEIEERATAPAEPSGNTGELAAFEIQRYADGAVDEHLPHVVLVDRNKPIPRSPGGIGCKCKGPFYPIRDDRGAKITCLFPGYTPSVCLCMGVFVWRPDCSAAQPATAARHSEALNSFSAYCKAHPSQRFWQALRNWSPWGYILAAQTRDGGTIDTFNLEGLDGTHAAHEQAEREGK